MILYHALTSQQVAKIVDFILSEGPLIGQALLSILGGLKVLARYTSSEADDKILSAIEWPFKEVVQLVFKSKPRP
jgi:hypothetical protein